MVSTLSAVCRWPLACCTCLGDFRLRRTNRFLLFHKLSMSWFEGFPAHGPTDGRLLVKNNDFFDNHATVAQCASQGREWSAIEALTVPHDAQRAESRSAEWAFGIAAKPSNRQVFGSSLLLSFRYV